MILIAALVAFSGLSILVFAPLFVLVVAHAAAFQRLRAERDALAEREADAQRLADQDPLTGLGNYRLFWRAIESEAARVGRHGGAFSLVLLDLNRFKAINDELGHRAGDEMLQRVAAGLRGVLRREDVLCRHGGDEFAVVAVQAGVQEAAHLADRLVDAVAESCRGMYEGFDVTATAGWATLGVHAETVEQMVLRADEALRSAKRGGGGTSALARAIGAPEGTPMRPTTETLARDDTGTPEIARLSFLGELAHRLAVARDTHATVETAVAHLAGAIDTLLVSVSRLSADHMQLGLAAFTGPTALTPRYTQPASSGVLGAVATNQRAEVVGDVRADHRYLGSPQLPEICSELAVPIFARGELWGVLNLESHRPDAYDADDLRLVEAVAAQLGRALACQWAFERLSASPFSRTYELAAAVEEPGEQSWRVADLAWRLGRELGLEGEELEALYLGGLFHDVGTVGVPTDVLLKPGRLTDDELELIHEHPIIGERLLRGQPRLRGAALVVRHEHERFDGAGYPDGLAGERIPLTSRALLACDAFVAMTSERAYRPPRSHEDAVAELRRVAGSQLDPEVVRALLHVLERASVATDA